MKKYKSYFLRHPKLHYIFLSCCILGLISCSNKNYSTQPTYGFRSIDHKPDYADLNYWAAHPWKKDPSDSVPAPLRNSFHQDSSVDVFFIHPTTLTSNDDPRWNADIDDSALNIKTDYSTILYQASVFNESCRVFAPRYRQAHIRSFFVPDPISSPYFEIAYEDIRAAFIYYLKYYNNGRPIIIASHSQGTKHAGRLLKEFFENKPLQHQLVCAYLIGMPIPDNYFENIKPCDDPLSTGCIISWRTFKNGYEGGAFIENEKFKTIVINPLSWTRDTLYIPASYNKGGVLKKFNKIVPRVADAHIHQNILWSGKPNVPGKMLLTTKNYHIGDINLYYMNIRENVAARIRAYLKN